MHSLLILGVYLFMLLSPCAVAQWGDVLTLPRWTFLSRRRRRRAMDPAFAELEDAFAAAELRRVMREAFVAPAALPGFGTAPANFAAAMEAVQQKDSFAAAASRVSARLAQLSAARHKALGTEARRMVVAGSVAMNGASVARVAADTAVDTAMAAAAPLFVPPVKFATVAAVAKAVAASAMAAKDEAATPPALAPQTWMVAAVSDLGEPAMAPSAAMPLAAAPMTAVQKPEVVTSFPFANAPALPQSVARVEDAAQLESAVQDAVALRNAAAAQALADPIQAVAMPIPTATMLRFDESVDAAEDRSVPVSEFVPGFVQDEDRIAA